MQAKDATFRNGGNETTAMTLGRTGSGVPVGIISDSFKANSKQDAADTANG